MSHAGARTVGNDVNVGGGIAAVSVANADVLSNVFPPAAPDLDRARLGRKEVGGEVVCKILSTQVEVAMGGDDSKLSVVVVAVAAAFAAMQRWWGNKGWGTDWQRAHGRKLTDHSTAEAPALSCRTASTQAALASSQVRVW